MMTEDAFSEKLGQLIKHGKVRKALDLADNYQRDGGVPRPSDWLLMGLASKALRRFDAAIQYFDKAIAMGEKSKEVPAPMLLAAACYEKADIVDDLWRETGDRELFKTAKNAYRESIEHGPSHFEAYYNLACIESLTGNKRKAIEYLALAINVDPKTVLEEMADDPDFRSLRDDPAFRDLEALDPDEIERVDQEDVFIAAFHSPSRSWEAEPLQLTCPICHEPHQYSLKVEKVTMGAKATGSFYKPREYRTTRIFVCPSTGKPFSAEITLTAAPATLIEAVLVSEESRQANEW